MYRIGSSSSTMGTLRRDYVARIPIDLDLSPTSPNYGTARVVINNSSVPNGVSVVRCRLDSDNTTIDHHHVEPYVVAKQPEVTSDVEEGNRKWPSPSSTSSESRETGSILKKPEYSDSQTLMSERSKRTPQGRRRVRFTNNVAMYRFDSDGVDSAYSSSECERVNAPPPVRKTVPNRYPTPNVVTPGSSLSKIKVSSSSDEYDMGRRSPGDRRILEEKVGAYLPSGQQQQVRNAKVYHSTPNGSLYLRNDFDRARSLPSVQWLGSTGPSPKAVPSVFGASSSLKSTSYALVTDPVTQEKKLMITARLSDVFHPNDITIKANKNGSKIRIVSSKATSSPTHQLPLPSVVHVSPRHQINEQIVLPVLVDPYKIAARLDPNGSLLIEAPCLA